MGKLITEETIVMTAKIHAPTSEQLRIAQLLGDKQEDHAATRDKCQKIMETTGCSESSALIALHDCNNSIEDAVHKILDGNTEQGEWTVKFRKARKSHNYSSSKENNEMTPSSDDFMGDDDTRMNMNASHMGMMTDGRSLSNRPRRGGPAGGGGFVGGFKSNSDPSQSRGRGRGAIRGPFRDRRRGGNENEFSANTEQSQERPPQRPGRNGGGPRGFNNDSMRGGRGGMRGGSSRRQMNNDSGFDGSMSTWANPEPESNTWDNSMATKWSGGNNNNNNTNRQSSGMGEWKNNDAGGGGINNNSSAPKMGNHPANSSSSNTWDNSMAHSVVPVPPTQQQQQKQQPNPAQLQQHQPHPQPTNQNSAAQAGQLTATANHVEEWNPTDDWGEEVDWQKMTNRVFTNMNQQPQKSVGVSGGGVNSVNINNNSTFISNVSEPKASDPTGITSHMRGESIDVNLLFGQKPSNEVSALNDASGSWTKQATDTLKNELGIGKVVSPSIEQSSQLISLTPRQQQYSTKPATAKVEMPNSVVNVGQIDVEFGEFSSIKMRSSALTAPDEQPTQNYFEFGTATAFTSTDLNLAQSAKDVASSKNLNAVNVNAANVYQHQQQQQQQRTPSKLDAQQIVNGGVVVAPTAPPTGINVDMGGGAPHGQSALGAGAGLLKDTSASVGVGPAKNAPSAVDMLSSSYPNAGSGGPYIVQEQFTNRSTSLLNSAPQQKSQSVSNVTSSESNSMPHLSKDPNVGQSIISLPSVQNIAGLGGYSTTANRAAVTTTAVSKPLINTTTIFNPATNPSYQALAAAAMPYIYPAADQNYLNAATLGFLSPHGIPFNTLGTLPFDLSSLNQVAPLAANNAAVMRDAQSMGGNNDVKQYGRSDIAISGANTSINAPPGLGPATVNNAEQAAQLLAPAAAAAAAYHPYSLMNTMQAPYFAPFVVPTVTNSSASTANSINQYPKNSVFASPVFYGGQDLQLPQDYGKNIYGMNIPTANQSKQAAGGGPNMSMNTGDVNNKAYAPTLKMTFDAKAFQNTATPPPGLGGVGFPTAFHSSGTYGAYPQFLPPQIGMMPPNMAQAAAINANDVMSGGGQRAGNPASKTGANLYGAKGYWPS